MNPPVEISTGVPAARVVSMNIRASVHSPRALPHGSAVAAFILLLVHFASGAEPMILTSASKQFTVKGKPQRSAFAANAKDDQIYINPAVLVASCDRIKVAVTKELGWIEPWHGSIFVNVHPLRFDNERPELQAFRTTEGWRIVHDHTSVGEKP